MIVMLTTEHTGAAAANSPVEKEPVSTRNGSTDGSGQREETTETFVTGLGSAK